VQQQQQPLQQHNGWLPQPWSSKGQQQLQQQAGNSWQQGGLSTAAQQGPHQQQRNSYQQPQDPVLQQLQDCQHWTQVAAAVQQQQQQQQELSFSYVTAALQQLSSCVQPKALPQQHQQQLDVLLTTLADAAVAHLQDLHHQEVGQLLARLQVLGFKPSVNWAKSVLQHAGTELVHYTPAELSLLLLTATQTAARVAGSAPPPMQLTRSSPTAALSVLMGAQASAADVLPYAADPLPYAADPLQYACPPPEIDMAAVAQAGSRSGSSSSSSITARRAPTVLTTAWLQHFMMTFERYLAARAAHPQLQPQVGPCLLL
jgi:flagellar motor protein MotB